MHITETGQGYIVSFDFNRAMIDDIKAIPGRQYNSHTKTWTVPKTETLRFNQFKSKYGYLLPVVESQQDYSVSELPDLDFDIPTMKRTPFPYQRRGIAYSFEKQRVIMGDQPGLGKTLQAIGTLEAGMAQGKQTYPALVICPSSLKENWKREFEMTTSRRAIVLKDSIKNTWHQYIKTGLADVIIVNYESQKKYFVAEINTPKGQSLSLKYVRFHDHIKLFQSVIIDELHRVKDSSTQQAKFTKGLATGKKYILGLTGTPVVNKPKDLISQLAIIDRLKDIGGYKFFMNRYCGGNGSGATNLKELQYKLSQTCFFQRKKQDVLKELPDKMRQIVMCDITTRKEYQDAIADLSSYLKEYRSKSDGEVERSMRGEVMVKIGICKNISARGKLNEVFEHIDEVIEAGEKIVVFIHQKEIAQALIKQYPHSVTVTGSDTTDKRQQAVDSFQKDARTNIIICNIKAGGVGITLTASSRVAFVELPWHAADADQCEDRCHRIGQKDSVQCTYFLGANTIDTHIYSIIEEKRAMAGTITGNEDSTQKEIINRLSEVLLN